MNIFLKKYKLSYVHSICGFPYKPQGFSLQDFSVDGKPSAAFIYQTLHRRLANYGSWFVLINRVY